MADTVDFFRVALELSRHRGEVADLLGRFGTDPPDQLREATRATINTLRDLVDDEDFWERIEDLAEQQGVDDAEEEQETARRRVADLLRILGLPDAEIGLHQALLLETARRLGGDVPDEILVPEVRAGIREVVDRGEEALNGSPLDLYRYAVRVVDVAEIGLGIAAAAVVGSIGVAGLAGAAIGAGTVVVGLAIKAGAQRLRRFFRRRQHEDEDEDGDPYRTEIEAFVGNFDDRLEAEHLRAIDVLAIDQITRDLVGVLLARDRAIHAARSSEHRPAASGEEAHRNAVDDALNLVRDEMAMASLEGNHGSIDAARLRDHAVELRSRLDAYVEWLSSHPPTTPPSHGGRG